MSETTIPTTGIRPAAATPGTLYTCPAGTEAVVHVVWSNDDAASTTIYVAIRSGGAVLDDTHYRVGPSYQIFANDTGERRSITLQENDIVEVLSVSGNVTFQVSGIERIPGTSVTSPLTVEDESGAPSFPDTRKIRTETAGFTITQTAPNEVLIENLGSGGGGADNDARILAYAAMVMRS